MLQLALNKTEDHYDSFDLKQTDLVMNQSRALQGLLGYRIFIIRKGTQDTFTKVKKIADLKN